MANKHEVKRTHPGFRDQNGIRDIYAYILSYTQYITVRLPTYKMKYAYLHLYLLCVHRSLYNLTLIVRRIYLNKPYTFNELASVYLFVTIVRCALLKFYFHVHILCAVFHIETTAHMYPRLYKL